MTTGNNLWTKEELKTYILLLCAKADQYESENEIDLIKSKIDNPTFDRVYTEISKDNEEDSLAKIQDNIAWHEYSNMELSKLRKEMHEVFLSDEKFTMMEKNIDRILDNIIY